MFREYSDILQLQTDTFLFFKNAPNGLARALQLFFVVALVAGIGVLFGIPVQASRPIPADVLDTTQDLIDSNISSVTPFLESGIPFISVPTGISESIGDVVEGAGEIVSNALAIFESEAELLEPPLGVTASRIFRQFGRWVSTPFQIMADYIGIALISMLAAKLIGGRATLSQHLTAVLLASAPLVLLLASLIPDLSPVTTLATATAITLFGRLIALIGLAWAAVILIKALALFHDFSWERAVWSPILTWLAIYLILPLASGALLAYLLRP